MFIWLRTHLETHPLWQHPTTTTSSTSRSTTPPSASGSLPPVLDGPTLAAALMVFLTEKPYRVLAAAGGMFAATDAARRDARGWAYFRLCFAAEAEANIDRAAERFVRGVHAFWEVRDVREIERLLGELQAQGGEGGASGREGEEGEDDGEEVCRLGWYMGC
jgi:hypothetical protein